MGLWSGTVNRSVKGSVRLENVKRITLDELIEHIMDIDNYEEKTYPILFRTGTCEDSDTFEVGGCVDDITLVDYQYFGKVKKDDIELIDIHEMDTLYLNEIKEMLEHCCDVGDEDYLYLDIEKSFTGKERYIDGNMSELENIHCWKRYEKHSRDIQMKS